MQDTGWKCQVICAGVVWVWKWDYLEMLLWRHKIASIQWVCLSHQTLLPRARGSHMRIACRSICDWDQNGIKRSTFFIGANQGIKTNSERLVSTNQHTFSNTKEAWLRICPLNSHKIKQSRTIFTDQDSWSQSQMLLQATRMWLPLPFNIVEVICAEIVSIVGGTELPSTPMVMAHPRADHST